MTVGIANNTIGISRGFGPPMGARRQARKQQMTIQTLLSGKKEGFKTIGPKVRVETAAALLYENRIGAFPVVDGAGHLIGIISERDIIRIIALHGTAGLLLTVEEVMTRNVVTATPRTPIKDIMQIMTERRFRHVPVLDDQGRLQGLVSIGDVLKDRLNAREMEMNVLRDVALAHK